MAIKAIGYKVIVRPDIIEKKTKSGLVLAVDEKLEQGAQVVGTIVDIGEDAFVAYKPKTPFCGLKKGDKVFYAKYAGKGLGDGLLCIVDDDICAKIE